jgi:hypothetical protein
MARHYANWLDAYVKYTDYSEAPTQFHFWSGVSAIAGALRRKVWIDQGYFQWAPNCYIVLVAPPGIVAKSTTAALAMDLLKKVPDVTMGPSAVTWQSLVQKLMQTNKVFQVMNEGDALPRFLSQSTMTCAPSELGTFLDPTNRELVDVLVDLWDSRAGDWTKSTLSGGDIVIKNPCLNIIGCTTSSWISSAMPEYMIGGGFTSRTVFVYGETKRKYVAYPAKSMRTGAFDRDGIRTKLIEDLCQIGAMAGEMTLSFEAEMLGEQWYEGFFKNLPSHLTTANYDGYIARKQTHIHKIAMIISAAESDDRIITESQLKRSIEIVTEVEAMMPKVFGNIGLSVAGKKSAVLVRFLKSGPVPLQALYGMAAAHMSWEEFEKVIKDLHQAKRVTTIVEVGVPKIKLL